MGKTRDTGFLTDCVFTDSSNNVGIGGAASGSYKFQVSGTGRFTGALTVGSSITASARVSGITQNTLEQFNAGGLTAFSNGNAFKYIQIGYDNTGNYGWIQALEQGTAYRNLILNAAGGNVGIGTTSPSTLLHISNATNPYLRVQNTTTSNNAYFGSDTSGIAIGTDSSTAPIIFYTGSSFTERMRITSGGQLLVGSSSSLYPNVKLSVKQTLGERTADIWSSWAGDQSTTALSIIKYDNVNTTSQIFVRFDH